MRRTRVLFTGFEPFDGDTINPSLEAVKILDDRRWDDVEFVAEAIPTAFSQSLTVLKLALETHRPDVVICVGQAGGRVQITPERVAINVNDARISDNDGYQPIDEPVVQGGPAAYWSTLPIKKLVQSLVQAGIPAAVSNSAGTYVCNHLFYSLMHELATYSPNTRGGFIHIPFLPEQAIHRNAPSMSIDLIVRGLELCGLTSAREQEDVRLSGGVES